MAAKLLFRSAGVLRTLRALFFRDPAAGGTLRTVRKAFYRDGGVLRQVFDIGGAPPPPPPAGGTPYMPGTLAVYDAGNAGSPATVQFHADGLMDYDTGGGVTDVTGAWLSSFPDPTGAALYEIRRTQVSGVTGVAFTGTMTSGTWYPLSVQRGVTVTASLSQRQNVSTWDIRLIGGPGTILATCTTTVTADP